MNNDVEREYWVEIDGLMVGADLYAQGTWEYDDIGFLVSDKEPVFYRYIAFMGDQEVELDTLDKAYEILRNVYWNTEEV